MKEDCIFCKLANGIIPCNILMQNRDAILINDKAPVAPNHALVIPFDHYDNLGSLYGYSQSGMLGKVFQLIDDYVNQEKLNDTGYRVVVNTGDDAGQTVKHLHFHILGGAKLKNDFGA